jgi:hypothetical protein
MAIIGGSSESINCLGNANCAISMTGFNYRNGIAGGGVWIDTQLGSSVIASGCNFNSVSVSVDSIANLGNSGIVTFDNCVFGLQGAASGIHGTAGAKLYIRGALFGGTYSSFLTAYTGTVGQNI